jgi:hypothetical protein
MVVVEPAALATNKRAAQAAANQSLAASAKQER